MLSTLSGQKSQSPPCLMDRHGWLQYSDQFQQESLVLSTLAGQQSQSPPGLTDDYEWLQLRDQFKHGGLGLSTMSGCSHSHQLVTLMTMVGCHQ